VDKIFHLIDLFVKDMFIEKEYGAEGLVLGRRGYLSFDGSG